MQWWTAEELLVSLGWRKEDFILVQGGKGGNGEVGGVAEAADWLHRERGHGGVQKMTEEGDGPGPGRGIFGDDAGSDGGRRAPTHPGDVWVSTVVLIGGIQCVRLIDSICGEPGI